MARAAWAFLSAVAMVCIRSAPRAILCFLSRCFSHSHPFLYATLPFFLYITESFGDLILLSHTPILSRVSHSHSSSPHDPRSVHEVFFLPLTRLSPYSLMVIMNRMHVFLPLTRLSPYSSMVIIHRLNISLSLTRLSPYSLIARRRRCSTRRSWRSCSSGSARDHSSPPSWDG